MGATTLRGMESGNRDVQLNEASSAQMNEAESVKNSVELTLSVSLYLFYFYCFSDTVHVLAFTHDGRFMASGCECHGEDWRTRI